MLLQHCTESILTHEYISPKIDCETQKLAYAGRHLIFGHNDSLVLEGKFDG